ncbi:Unconventional myosin-XVIIIa like [Heracleum sosnowskyi]|uniref:Unconventional myosin-XVIIIa like n=1 Tax=Heracleum sosnowskyi TaxID=360622 RepID=A0AAD8IWL3_9APIA|nr:Unconventional myosin-XVIIIa like [Heracleum sosnowskyi]
MEAPAGVAAVSLPIHRKEWRAVNEHLQNPSNEVQQSAELDFCSITIDANMDSELQQRLHSVVKQREELQHMETGIKAELIARSQIVSLHNTYESQIKEHVNANVKLQEQLREREQAKHELEREIENKERELHAIRLDTQEVWAKDDLLREQNKELTTFRRERDNSEAERAQHIKQIHDFQEHIQEKERQLMELQEQHRASQETLIFKDEQLREAQTWITRAQEMDALQTSTNQTLQAELRERIEQYNQLWMNCQRQFAEFVHTIQALQIELADLREKNATSTDESRAFESNIKDASQSGNNVRNQLNVGGDSQTHDSGTLPNGNLENDSSSLSQGSALGHVGQTNSVASVPIVPQSLVGMPTYLPGQMAALHPFLMHQQAVPQSGPTHVPQSHTAYFHSVPVSSLQQWQNQQAASEGLQMPSHDQHPSSQSGPNLVRVENTNDYEVPVNGKHSHSEHLDHVSQEPEPHAVITNPAKGLESTEKHRPIDPQPQNNLQQLPSQFQDGLKLNSLMHSSETENINTPGKADAQVSRTQQPSSAALIPKELVNRINSFEQSAVISANVKLPSEASFSSEKKTQVLVEKSSEVTLLDQGSLLRCIVRTIPPNGRIRISSTLPNRLGKMLSPLHWHDYKKSYGKLDDFVAGHPELFVIEGDYIQLREGAQEIIAATAAFAKVKAAASATSPNSSLLPSVANLWNVIAGQVELHRKQEDRFWKMFDMIKLL